MRIRIIDAFADRPFAGNPAAVCLLDGDDWPDEAWMRRVAAEMNLSETAFARPLPDGEWALRWFTPTVETKLCGHATLATTHALHSDGRVNGPVRTGWSRRSAPNRRRRTARAPWATCSLCCPTRRRCAACARILPRSTGSRARTTSAASP